VKKKPDSQKKGSNTSNYYKFYKNSPYDSYDSLAWGI